MSSQQGNGYGFSIASVTPPPPYPDHTFLLDLAIWTYIEATKWYDTAEDIENVAILGQYLYLPFYAVAQVLETLSTFFGLGDDFLVDMKSWLDSLIDGTKFQEILDFLSDNYRRIRENPIDWIIETFTSYSGELSDFIYTPFLWLSNLIGNWVDWWLEFIDTPYEWIIHQIETFAFWIRVFIEDPGLFIESWVGFLWPDYWSFKANPLGFILEKLQSVAGWFGWFINWPGDWIVETLRNLAAQIGLFLDDPIDYIRQRLSSELGIPIDRLFDLDFWLFEQFLQKIENWIWQQASSIIEILCNIIVDNFI